jgi:acyl-CoA thioesterase-1
MVQRPMMEHRRHWTGAGIVAFVALTSACSSERPQDTVDNPPTRQQTEASSKPKIVVLGDSITAGYGLSRDQAFPALIQERLETEGYSYEVANAGVPGDTTAGGVRRLDWVLDGDVRILIVALGGNDGLRGLPVTEIRRNLSTIVERALEHGALVLLTGMEAPPNHGEEYTSQFREAYREISLEYDVALMPFLLEGVGGMAEFNQRDGIHPNEEGQALIAKQMWEVLRPLLKTGESL